jgi:hypothetical protein
MLNGIFADVINAECRKQAYYAECRYAKCRGAFLFHSMLFFSDKAQCHKSLLFGI